MLMDMPSRTRASRAQRWRAARGSTGPCAGGRSSSPASPAARTYEYKPQHFDAQFELVDGNVVLLYTREEIRCGSKRTRTWRTVM